VTARESPGGANEPIAIVGIGCRFPGKASDPDGFWRLLRDGVDAVTTVPPDRWSIKDFYDPEPGTPGKTIACRGGFIDGIDEFDAAFFAISPREAARMDPQQRLLLEVSWEALEDGGFVAEHVAGSDAGVFIGISSQDYMVIQQTAADLTMTDAYTNTGGALSIAANRLSYALDLRGPSLAVDTACSSSLVAVHLACHSLWRHECALALAGGVNLLLKPEPFVGFSRLSMLAPDGRCKAFHARADGYVRSEGAGVVVLKPLARARQDGDRVYAVILGTAINQDGRTSGLTVPSQRAQEAVVREACRQADIVPSQVQFVEAHGTGTPVGDPIEARALGSVLGVDRSPGSVCRLGSVKTNLGHLEPAAGIAGLIKVALALWHRMLPPNLHCDELNPDIPFAQLGLRVQQGLEPWPERNGPPLAGVNSFGFGGTNAHVIVQGAAADAGEPAGAPGDVPSGRAVLVPLSARSPEALCALARAYQAHVRPDGPGADVRLEDVSFTACRRRSHHDHRVALVAHSRDELVELLEAHADGEHRAAIASGCRTSSRSPRLAFMCAGQGPQWWAMGRQLLEEDPVFRQVIEACHDLIEAHASWSLLDELTARESRSRLHETALAQPAIFALQVALARRWQSWGIEPDAVVGHSVGEVAAAHIAGALDLEDAVRVIVHRGRCMELASSRGRMLAAGVSLPEAERLVQRFNGAVSIAAINGPTSITLSGDGEPLEEIFHSLSGEKRFCRFLPVNYAFHSAQMDPVRGELLQSLNGIRPKTAALPFVSTVTGRAADGSELDADYWWQNVRRPVQFAAVVDVLLEQGYQAFVELSPHPVLARSVADVARQRQTPAVVLASLRRGEEERATMLQALAAVYAIGREIRWPEVVPGDGRLIRLPAYPWQRERHWHESEDSRRHRLGMESHPLLGRRLNAAQPIWENTLDRRVRRDLRDHCLQGHAVLSGTSYIEMALAAARTLLGDGPRVLEDLQLPNACFLPEDHGVKVQTLVTPGESSFAIHGQRPGDQVWTLHAQGKVRDLARGTVAAPVNLDEVRRRCRREMDGPECYARLRALGLEYGPVFQGLQRLWCGDGEALGLIQVPEGWAASGQEYQLHPALLDACWQVFVGARPLEAGAEENVLYLPTALHQAWVFGPTRDRMWSHARLVSRAAGSLVVDLLVVDDGGEPIVDLRGLRLSAVGERGAHAEDLDDLVHEYQWHPEPLSGPPPSRLAAADGQGQWLIFADDGGVGQELAAGLRGRGELCCVVTAAASYRRSGSYQWEIAPGEAAAMRRLLGELGSVAPGAYRRIVHLWSLNAPGEADLAPDDLPEAQRPGCLSALHLAQALGEVTEAGARRLWLVTRGAQSVGQQGEPIAVVQAPLWGLGRVMAHEMPAWRPALIDLGAGAADEEIRSLLEEVWADGDEDEIALRGNVRYVHRYVRGSPRAAPRVVRLGSEPFCLEPSESGTLEHLTLRACARRPPGPGEVEIQVAAAGLNFSDVLKALGLYPGLPEGRVPLGIECSGRISAVGQDVDRFRVGDEVVGIAPFSLAVYVIVPVVYVAPKPDRLSFEEAATVPIAFLTAHYALNHLGRLAAGERVLIHSATGGVGLAAVQLARRVGAEVFATAGTAEKREMLRGLGIEHAMDSRSLAFADEVLEATGGQGVDVILNSLAGDAIPKGLSILADYGRFLEIGKRDIYQNSRLGLLPFRKNLSFVAIDLDRAMRERPGLISGLFQALIADVGAGLLEPLPFRAFPIADVVAAFRSIAQARHIGKVVITFGAQDVSIVPSTEEEVSFPDDATYLITGGLGGFGLAAAGWMVGRGARHLVLVGRRGADAGEAREAVEALRGMGADVMVAKADVASVEQVSRVLAQAKASMPPLRGILHAAGIIEDGLLANLTAEQLEAAQAPKAKGAWNLHRQTMDTPLDFFVLFSSVVSVCGNAGQAGYASANAFLDALAHHRQARGLTATSINWGHLGGVGWLARRGDIARRLERQGITSFSPKQALALLGRVLRTRPAQVGILRVDWPRWARAAGAVARSPRFARLVQVHAGADIAASSPAAPTARGRLLTADPSERPALMQSLLSEQVAKVLGAAAARIDVDKPLTSLGMDSLTAVDLQQWIERDLRVSLPSVELMREPTISGLAARLLQQLQQEATDTAPPETLREIGAAGGLGSVEALLAKVDEMPDEQVDALLRELQANDEVPG